MSHSTKFIFKKEKPDVETPGWRLFGKFEY